jgi:hypothetical protein
MRRCFLLFVLVFLAVPASRAQQWEAIHSGFGISGTAGTDYAVNMTGFDGTYLYANVWHVAERRLRLFRSPDQGTTWQERPDYAAAGGSNLQALTARGGRLYAIHQSGGAVLYSDDQGTTWTNVAAGTTSGGSLARVGQRVIVARGLNLTRVSTDGGATWADGPAGVFLNYVTDNGRAYLGLNFAGQLTRSADGTTWTSPTVSGAFIFTWVWSVGTTFYAKAAAGSVYASTDDGVTWSATATANPTAFSYVYPNASGSAWLLIGAPANGTTLLRTTNRAEATADITLNYPKVVGSPTALCTSNFTATTDYAIGNAWQCSIQPGNPGGAGLYRFRLTAGVAAEPNAGTVALSVTLAPNPVAERLTVRAANVPAGPVRVAVYDARGRQVALLHDGAAPGPLAATLDVSGMASGVYLVRLVAGGVVVTRPVVVR